ncbi:MAG: hypothetical protein M0R06_03135 [Sphaerochaeta sp.]|jgi:hypothetical protein|nr:hypothetical protein [Sphaerochaeta sp.]
MASTTKKKSPPALTCSLCPASQVDNPKRRMLKHHVCYNPEIKRPVCWPCHLRLHGTGRTFGHSIDKEYGKANGPLVFALRVVDMYAKAGIWVENWKKEDGNNERREEGSC